MVLSIISLSLSQACNSKCEFCKSGQPNVCDTCASGYTKTTDTENYPSTCKKDGGDTNWLLIGGLIALGVAVLLAIIGVVAAIAILFAMGTF